MCKSVPGLASQSPIPQADQARLHEACININEFKNDKIMNKASIVCNLRT